MKGNKVSEYKPHYLKALYFKGKKKKRGRKKGGAGGSGEGREMRKTKKRKTTWHYQQIE